MNIAVLNAGRGRLTPPQIAEAAARRGRVTPPHRVNRGSVLIIVIWVCLGLVALTVYFASAMSSELRAADNRAAEIAARAAVDGGTRYAGYILSQFATAGKVPNREDYKAQELPVGDATFWFIGRDPDQTPSTEPFFGLIDEASKINVNTAPRSMLEALPGMTPELADAILQWRTRSRSGSGSDNDNLYARLDPPRVNKAGVFETVDELRLVYGATLDILFGEDINRNGALDDNENDNEQSAPLDNGDGLIQPGILEYLTVYTREPNTTARGGRRTNIQTNQARQQFGTGRLRQLLSAQRAQQITAAAGTGEINSILEYMVRGRITPEEFARIRDEITTSNGSTVSGLINVNTASETVLSCIPGIGPEYASAILAYRAAHPDTLVPFTWLPQVMPASNLIRAGRYLTDRSYQFSVDVAAVGNAAGRGYCREKTVFDMRRGTPRIIFHQDLTAYGWALGAEVRETLREGRNNRT